MLSEAKTIEDCLELIAGLKSGPKFELENSDVKILYSIARQVFKGVGLTDRQHELVKIKLLAYSDQFNNHNICVNELLNNLRMPIRSIDRSRWLKLKEVEDELYLGLRFTFNKKLIQTIEPLRVIENRRLFDSLNKIHYYHFTLKNLKFISDKIKDKNFIVDETLQVILDKLENYENNKQDYLPGVFDLDLKNLNKNAYTNAIAALGEPNIENLALYKDRRWQFGLEHFDETDLDASYRSYTNLSKKIINRTQKSVYINSEEYSINNLVHSIVELKRYPILVMLPDEDPLSLFTKIYKAFDGVFSRSSQAVYFRLDNSTEYNRCFNQAIKDYSCNNTIDKETKIVYINKKITKPLARSNWRPNIVLRTDTVMDGKVNAYLEEIDLSIQYAESYSHIDRYTGKLDII